MDFTGRYVIPAPPEKVWEGLNDPLVLKACIPGCERMEKVGPSDFEAAATLKIGPVRATFRGKVAMTDVDAPNRCTLRGEGQGGVAGFAKGEAEVQLAPDADGTVLTYKAKASVGGRLAQIGQRLVDGAARQLADEFFSRFAKAVAPQTVPSGSGQDAAERATAASTVEERATIPREGVAPEIWVIGLIAVIAILLVVFRLLL